MKDNVNLQTYTIYGLKIHRAELTQAELTQGRVDSGDDLTSGRVDPLPTDPALNFKKQLYDLKTELNPAAI